MSQIFSKGTISGTIQSNNSIKGNIKESLLHGMSAYEIAIKNGLITQEVTEEEWLNSLKGEIGNTPVIEVGEVESVDSNSSPRITITGTNENPILNMWIPRGIQGQQGERGYSIQLQINGTSIEYKYENQNDWTELVDLKQAITYDDLINKPTINGQPIAGEMQTDFVTPSDVLSNYEIEGLLN